MQFDANQAHQADAINALVDVFKGQQQRAVSMAPILGGEEVGVLPGLGLSENGIGNWLYLSEGDLLKNVRGVQLRNGIASGSSADSLAKWSVLDPTLGDDRDCYQFSIEMETGTGKTYVYLRSIMELADRYGYRKFCIVVPSIAIREGTLKNLEQLRDHLASLYRTPLEFFVYDSKNTGRLREYANSDSVQVMIINIAAFIKDSSDESEGEATGTRSGNVIYRAADALAGRRPIDFVHAARPIVIIDEPQSVDSTDKARDAIKRLNPMFIVRYSATHRDRYNVLYVLDPIKAFELRLVKQIWVESVIGSDSGNDAYVQLKRVNADNQTAKLTINVKTKQELGQKDVTVKMGDDLFDKSGKLPAYKEGFAISEINFSSEEGFVQFANGVQVRLGATQGTVAEEIQRRQIEKTVEHHFKKVAEIDEQGLDVKVLTLFFIDKVANYRIDPDDPADQGRFARIFVEAFKRFAAEERFRVLDLAKLSPDQVHAGYFSRDKKGFRDSREGRETQNDEDTFSLIMRNKEKLLSKEEPVQFIFSHSALREGWDNPNVFQICTLNETSSAMKKRQEIGRGLRIPVDQSGKRVFDEQLNRLVVVANESYEEFANKLQKEYEEDGNVVFGIVPIESIINVVRYGEGGNRDLDEAQARDVALRIQVALQQAGIIDRENRIAVDFDPEVASENLTIPEGFEEILPEVIDLCVKGQITSHVKKESARHPNPLKREVLMHPDFKALWEHIRPRTTYALHFDSERFIRQVAGRLREGVGDIEAPHISTHTARLIAQRSGLDGETVAADSESLDLSKRPLQDVLSYLQEGTDLTRSTLLSILRQSTVLNKIFVNPQAFLDRTIEIVNRELGQLMEHGIKYERLTGQEEETLWQMEIFDEELPVDTSNETRVAKVDKSIYDYIHCDSNVEFNFALTVDAREDIKLFFKLPRRFKVDTPVGRYNPDWAIVKENGQTLLLVRETKGTTNLDKLPFWQEKTKVLCGEKHFDLLGVDYRVVKLGKDV